MNFQNFHRNNHISRFVPVEITLDLDRFTAVKVFLSYISQTSPLTRISNLTFSSLVSFTPCNFSGSESISRSCAIKSFNVLRASVKDVPILHYRLGIMIEYSAICGQPFGSTNLHWHPWPSHQVKELIEARMEAASRIYFMATKEECLKYFVNI